MQIPVWQNASLFQALEMADTVRPNLLLVALILMIWSIFFHNFSLMFWWFIFLICTKQYCNYFDFNLINLTKSFCARWVSHCSTNPPSHQDLRRVMDQERHERLQDMSFVRNIPDWIVFVLTRIHTLSIFELKVQYNRFSMIFFELSYESLC